MEKRVGWEAGVRCGDSGVGVRLLYQSGWATRVAWPGGAVEVGRKCER